MENKEAVILDIEMIESILSEFGFRLVDQVLHGKYTLRILVRAQETHDYYKIEVLTYGSIFNDAEEFLLDQAKERAKSLRNKINQSGYEDPFRVFPEPRRFLFSEIKGAIEYIKIREGSSKLFSPDGWQNMLHDELYSDYDKEKGWKNE